MRAVRRDDSGAVAIIVALMAVVLFGFAALVVDVGNAYDVREQASAAADAGVLAGERYLAGAVAPDGSVSDATAEELATTVQDAVDANYPAAHDGWAACIDASVPTGFTPVTTSQCVEYEVVTSDGAPIGTSVRVRIPLRKVASTFGGIFGVSSISVSPVAAARGGQDPPSPCLPCDPRLDYTSGEPAASTISLRMSVQDLLPDPRSIDPPATAVDPSSGCPTSPGRYDADVDVTGTGTCTLPAGLYVFNNSEFHVAASVSGLTGTNVTLVFYGTDASPLTLATSSVNLKAVLPGLGEAACGRAIPGVVIVIDGNGGISSSSPATSASGVPSVTPTDTTSASNSAAASTTPSAPLSPADTPTDTATDTPGAPSSAPVSSAGTASVAPTPVGSAPVSATMSTSPPATSPPATAPPTAAPTTPPTPTCNVASAPATAKQSFDLGPSFDITGSVYAVDGDTTWVTANGECTVALDCRIQDDGQAERIAVTSTAFAGGVAPAVGSDHDPLLAPPQPEHLSE